MGLALASITKISPIMLGGYLAVQRRYREAAAAIAAIVVVCGLALARYGPQAFVSFPDAFLQLSGEAPRGMSLASLGSALCQGDPPAFSVCASAGDLQLAVGIYLAAIGIVSGVASRILGEREPFFIVTCLAIMLYPNILWYHHFVFFLVPLLVWIGWASQHRWVLAWVLAGMLVVQIDRWYLTHGLLIHLFGNASILLLLGDQLRRVIRRRRQAGPSEAAERVGSSPTGTVHLAAQGRS
jgi:hypothetical protein